MLKTVFIYVLKDPRTGEVRYVGKSSRPKQRLLSHVSRAKKMETNHRATWIRSLVGAGCRPLMEIVDEVSEEFWQSLEAAYIEFYRDSGCDLTNGTPGGDDGPILRGPANPRFGKKHSVETRAKISRARKGQVTEAQRLVLVQMALGNVGRKMSEEERQKHRAAALGRPKNGRGARGFPKSAAHRAAMVKAWEIRRARESAC